MDIQVNTLEEMCDLMCDNKLPKEYQFCKRCGRKLKSKESKLIGYGKVCLEKTQTKHKGYLFCQS